MKRYIVSIAAIFSLSALLLTACGGNKGKKAEESVWRGVAPGMEDLTALTERTEYYDIAVEAEDLFAYGLENGIPLGTQFLQGEPVQLWAETESGGANIYLYRKDGSRELLLEGVANEYISTRYRPNCKWYIDQEGNYYCYGGTYCEADGIYSENEGFLVKCLSSGAVLYETVLEQDIFIRDLCQMEDGRVYLLLLDRTEDKMFGVWKLAEVDPVTGEPVWEAVRELPWKFEVCLGKADNFPAATGYSLDTDRQISKVDMAEGELSPILYFTGISYGWHDDLVLQDFQVRKDGKIELLWTKAGGEGGLLERLKMEKVEKITIVVRGRLSGEKWFGNRVLQFNRENSVYHVVVEDCGSGNDVKDFARLTSIQIGTGGGPDIISGSLMKDYMQGLLDKGALEELTPYIEASDVREEDFFPLTFASLRQGERIYGANYSMWVWDFKAEEQLESRDVTDIETLTDALLAREGEALFCQGYDAGEVLRTFLQGSESLWGMVDWEKNRCKFDSLLFGRLLEVARRYGDDGRKSIKPIAVERDLNCVLDLEGLSGSHETEMEGKVTSGVLFDDGCHAVSQWGYALSINANSLHKEGAWEFIRFLISEEAQTSDFSGVYPPVQRKAFDVWTQWFLDKYTNVYREGMVSKRVYNGRLITDKMCGEFKARIEDARPLPIRTAPLLDIILEEAGDYFNGSKSAEEVSEVINKRVQLYLDERK